MRRFRHIRPVGLGGALTLLAALWPSAAHACAACFGRSDSKMALGMNMGIFALLFVIVCVLGSLAGFMIFLVRRAAALERQSTTEPAAAPDSPAVESHQA